MMETGVGICVTHLFSFARGGNYSPIRIHQKVFSDLCYFHKVETF